MQIILLSNNYIYKYTFRRISFSFFNSQSIDTENSSRTLTKLALESGNIAFAILCIFLLLTLTGGFFKIILFFIFKEFWLIKILWENSRKNKLYRDLTIEILTAKYMLCGHIALWPNSIWEKTTDLLYALSEQ